jgi:RNA polymerase sigma-70 factor, ECF subfamily
MNKKKQQYIFDSWLNEYSGIFFKVVKAYAFTPQDQDDLFQEISIQVWRSIPNFREEAAVSTWIYRIALNIAVSWTRSEKRRLKNAVDIDDREPVLQVNMQGIDPQLQWLYEQISKLNEIDRSLILLLLDGFSYSEIADTLGISESNAGVKIHRIKEYLTGKSKKENEYGT